MRDTQHFNAGVSDNIHRILTQVKWGLDNCLSKSAYTVAVVSLYMSACIKVLPSSYNYRQIHHFVINGNSCSRTDCKMVISCEDLQRTVTRQIFLFLFRNHNVVPQSHYLHRDQKMNFCCAKCKATHWSSLHDTEQQHNEL